MLLSEILMGDFIKISNLVHRNTNIIRDRLHSKRILLVLDDIDDYKQLEVLAGKLDWFGHGSKIIVTTRDTHLISEFDKQYFIQGLSHDKALELFGWYAFKKTISDIPSDYLDLSKRAVDYCKGLPLGLEVLGSFLCNRDQSKWKSILDSYEKSSLDKRIQDILQISYNGLEDEIKELFLDISCLFVGEHIDDVKAFLEACGSYPEKGIGILIDLLLVTIILHHLNRTLMRERIQMHDLIQQMGRTIALSKFSNPRKRKRLFIKDDVEDVLNDNKEAGAVKAIKLNFSKPTKLDIGAQGFRNVKNLMFLKIHGAIFSGDLEYLPSRLKWIDWPEFPFSSFPLGFTPKNVIKLNLLCSSIKHLGGVMNWESLKQICLQGSKFLTEIPDFSTALNLEWLDLEECTSLVKVHESVGSLETSKPPQIEVLQQLELSGCVTLEAFPHIGEEMKSCASGVGHIFLYKFTSLPLYCLLNLEDCSIVLCSSFTRISCPCPFSFSSSSSSVLLPNLRTLQLSYCNISDLSFLEILSQSAPFLAYLDLSGNEFSSLPCWMVNFESLTSLVIHDCKSLEDISKVPECIHQILAEGCISLVKYPDNIADIISYNLDYEDEVEFGYREFVLVNWDIPYWYIYKKANNNDNSITFWMSDDESRKLKGLAPSIVTEGRGHPTTSYDDFPVQSRVSPSTNVLRQPRDKRSFHHGSHDDFLVKIRVSLSANGSRQIHGERSFHYVSLCAHTWLLVFGVENFTQMDGKCNDTNEREIDGGICFKVLFEIISGKEMVFIKNCGVHLIYEEDDD
ncbi:unnamed protein product [Citrullus colocynthis]|uniref:Uncharacterized protein n=1 Tax=Citrullus colocynthis TaxID=252529 RepID=A0ABP0Y5S1_9ROSI